MVPETATAARIIRAVFTLRGHQKQWLASGTARTSVLAQSPAVFLAAFQRQTAKPPRAPYATLVRSKAEHVPSGTAPRATAEARTFFWRPSCLSVLLKL